MRFVKESLLSFFVVSVVLCFYFLAVVAVLLGEQQGTRKRYPMLEPKPDMTWPLQPVTLVPRVPTSKTRKAAIAEIKRIL